MKIIDSAVSNPSESLTIDLATAPPWVELEPLWLQLEAQADCSFFTSWAWIRCWLRGLDPQMRPLLLRATRGNQVVGLAL